MATLGWHRGEATETPRLYRVGSISATRRVRRRHVRHMTDCCPNSKKLSEPNGLVKRPHHWTLPPWANAATLAPKVLGQLQGLSYFRPAHCDRGCVGIGVSNGRSVGLAYRS